MRGDVGVGGCGVVWVWVWGGGCRCGEVGVGMENQLLYKTLHT